MNNAPTKNAPLKNAVVSQTPVSLKAIVSFLGTLATSFHEEGASETSVRAVSSPDLATQDDLVFISQPQLLEQSLLSPAKAFCFHEKLRDTVTTKAEQLAQRPHFFSREPERAMRETIQEFFQKTPYVNRDTEILIHPTAVLHPTAHIGDGVRVGPYAVIAKDVVLEHGASIGAHCVIETGAHIGARTVIHPLVYIGHSCSIGVDCEIHPSSVIGKEGFGYAHDAKNNHYRIPHLGRVVIGDRVHLGANVTIDRGTFGETRIDSGAILDNRVHLAHNVTVGENSIITSGFSVAGSSKIGRNFLTGGNSSVTGHVEICDNVQIAGVSVVRKSISTPGAYGGNPLVSLKDSIRMNVALTKLPSLLKALGLAQKKETDS
ncbi:MAG: UDP-3-O-(3-hydroxymyristoyl)glucosamine N-acyltransferase [Bdellovibrionales bacterium]|nr:UDP-3-O-(3-hydroxymyristoyl)glucosamine N-acyltransferase [Bdellovibrionales bacterium]